MNPNLNQNVKTVLGIYNNRPSAETAVDKLDQLGFNVEEISLLMKDSRDSDQVVKTRGDHVAEGAATGAATGGAIGGFAGLILGAGLVAIPGIGALLIGGPIAAALGMTGVAATAVSAAATGALAGGVVGGLAGLGVPEETARLYESRIQEGGVLLAVPTDTTVDKTEVMRVLKETGADQITNIDLKRRS